VFVGGEMDGVQSIDLLTGNGRSARVAWRRGVAGNYTTGEVEYWLSVGEEQQWSPEEGRIVSEACTRSVFTYVSTFRSASH